MARHSLQLQRCLDQLFYLRVGIAPLPQLFGNRQRLRQRHFGLHGHKLCNGVHRAVGNVHYAPHIADDAARGKRAEGDDLRHVVGAVFADYVVDYLLPPLIAKIDIKIRHGNTLRIQKAFKQQVILDGIDIGNAHAVRGKAARAGAAPGPYGDPSAFCVIDKVVYD